MEMEVSLINDFKLSLGDIIPIGQTMVVKLPKIQKETSSGITLTQRQSQQIASSIDAHIVQILALPVVPEHVKEGSEESYQYDWIKEYSVGDKVLLAETLTDVIRRFTLSDFDYEHNAGIINFTNIIAKIK